jgi:hypothetical protein
MSAELKKEITVEIFIGLRVRGDFELLDMNPIGRKIWLVGHPARLPHSGLEQDAGVLVESEKGTFPLKTFQFDFAKRTDRKQFSELCVRGFAQRAPLA